MGGLIGVACFVANTGRARADDPPKPTYTRIAYSPYEQATVERTLKTTGFVPEVDAEGKILESVEIVRLEVIEDRDPAPAFLNVFHATTKDYIVRREALLKPGDRYISVVANETARNLRNLFPLSLVVIVPVKGSDDAHVRMLVITKDVWSFRLTYDLAATKQGIERFTIAPQEVNLAGLHHTARTQFTYQPESLSFGVGYKIPRFGYSWVGASTDLGLTVNRRSGELEGYSVRLGLSQPLYSTRTPWAWAASGGASEGIVRRYSNAALYVDPRTGVPFEYRSRSQSAGAAVTRSFGWRYKLDLSAGYYLSVASTEMLDRPLLDPAKVAEFARRNLPVGETRSVPSFTLHTYTTDFIGITDFGTLGLQEDYRLGHDLYAQAYASPQFIGSTRDVVGAYLGAQYTWALGDGLVRTSVKSATEVQLNGDAGLSDATLSGDVNVVSPGTGLGRFVFSASASNRYRNYLNRQSFLGGDGRLRGYPTSFVSGKDFVVGNLEFRTRPLEILSCQLGAVFFYDVGDAMQGFDRLRPKQSLGGGIRVLLPQLNRAVFRADIGFPMNKGPFPGLNKVDPVNFYVAFEQAFGFGGIGP